MTKTFALPYKDGQSCAAARRAYREFWGWDYPHDDAYIRERAREIRDEAQKKTWDASRQKGDAEPGYCEQLLWAMREDDPTPAPKTSQSSEKASMTEHAKYYADLNPAYGAQGAGRWAVFYRQGPRAPSIKLHERKSRRAAEQSAAGLERARLALIADIAERFVARLRGALTDAEWTDMIARNRAETSADICHSHDFLDANVVMADAFAAAAGRDVDLDRDEDIDLWSEAWSLAAPRLARLDA